MARVGRISEGGETAAGSDIYERVPLRNGFPSFSEAEIQRRHTAMRRLLEEHGAAGLLLYGAGRFCSDLQYLSNWPGGREGYLLLPIERDPILLVQLYNHVPVAAKLSLIPAVRWAGADSMVTVAECLKDLVGSRSRIGLAGPLPFAQYERMRALLPEAQLIDLTRVFRELRMVYSAEELEFFRAAAQLTDRSLERLEQQLRPGLREYELPAIVESAYLEAGGYAGIHFMASTPMREPTAFVPHQYQSDRRLEHGDVLITEISGAFWGYTGQIHRSFFLGDPTPEYVRLHDAAVAAFLAVEAVLRHGASVEQVLDAAEEIDRRGYTIFDDLLHGANQYPPILRTWSTDHGHPQGFVFQENMVVTIQPHLTTPDRRIGLQFGETVRITRDGVERLHDYPRKMVIVT